jgi:LmbE family N-acetylglucosaminyl deacetylase
MAYADSMIAFEQYSPKVVLAVGAHADDIDFGYGFGASGSIAKWASEGAEVHYLVLTDGCKGTADTSMSPEQLRDVRQKEQRSAAQALGAREVHFLDYEDCALEATTELKRDIVRVIRSVQPDTVIVLDPTMVYVPELNFINHTDHRAAGLATLDAVYPMARDHLCFPELARDEQLEPHRVEHVLLINLEKQNYYVDISDTIDLKLAAITAHSSQMLDKSEIAELVRQRAATFGRKTGSRYAEGFMRIDTEV